MSLPGQHHQGNASFDELLKYCWSQQECWGCLDRNPCSWCPTTSTCIPNNATIQLLAPISNPDICPLWSERWELRARPLGCHVSTITFFTCVVSVLATFLVVILGLLGFWFERWVKSIWKGRQEGWWRVWEYYQQGWWRGWRLKLVNVGRGGETERSPLLGEA